MCDIKILDFSNYRKDARGVGEYESSIMLQCVGRVLAHVGINSPFPSGNLDFHCFNDLIAVNQPLINVYMATISVKPSSEEIVRFRNNLQGELT